MATIKAQYYTEELSEWKRLISFFYQEIDEFGTKLAEVIQRNTIPDISTKVEEHQGKLNAVLKKFKRLQMQIRKQETALKADDSYIDDTLIITETEKHQSELRRNMQPVEKEYIDTKYACYNFLSETLKKRDD